MALTPRILRSRTTQPWITFGHDDGRCSLQTTSASSSELTSFPQIPLDRERAENGDAHTLTVDLPTLPVNGGDTAVIPAPTAAIPP